MQHQSTTFMEQFKQMLMVIKYMCIGYAL